LRCLEVSRKLFAASCDSDRKLKDLADIKEIVKNAEVDKLVLRKLFIKYRMEEYYESIVG